MALGLGSDLPTICQRRENSLSSMAFSGLPWPTKMAGSRWAEITFADLFAFGFMRGSIFSLLG
jgi:hypothetical protein